MPPKTKRWRKLVKRVINKKPAKKKVKNVKKKPEAVTKVDKELVSTFNADPETHVTVGTVRTFKLPEGWDVKKALKVFHVSLPTEMVNSVVVPVTAIEMHYGFAPPIYGRSITQDSVDFMATVRPFNQGLQWSTDVNGNYRRDLPPFLLRGVVRRACPH